MVQPNWQGGEFICRTSLCWLYIRQDFELIFYKNFTSDASTNQNWLEILFSSGTMIAINTVIHVDRSIGITKPLLREWLIHFSEI